MKDGRATFVVGWLAGTNGAVPFAPLTWHMGVGFQLSRLFVLILGMPRYGMVDMTPGQEDVDRPWRPWRELAEARVANERDAELDRLPTEGR